MRIIPLLRRTLGGSTAEPAADSKRFGALEGQLAQAFQGILKIRLSSVRLRCHGDMTLSRFVSTGSEFILTDWSGPAESTFSERRIKRSPLSDVASMINSFRLAATAALKNQLSSGELPSERWPLLEAGAAAWYGGVATRYLKSYRENVQGPEFGLGKAEEVDLLLLVHLLGKMLDEMAAALGEAVPLDVLLKTLSDLLDAVSALPKPGPAAATSENAWPEARAWMSLLKEAAQAPASVKAASPAPGTPLGPRLESTP